MYARLIPWAPRVLSILRIVAALVLLQHGLMKIAHFPVPQPGVPDPLPPLLLAAGWIELVGGLLLLLGLFSRPAAFILAGEMAFAYFIGHAGQSFYPALNMGEPAVLLCFVFLYLTFAGPGPWSLDAAMRKRS